ncbi:MAG: FAD-dependent oxidoreductase [Pseudomonadales bacterium]
MTDVAAQASASPSEAWPDVDVAVVGGGLIGATAALAASRLGFEVAVIDRAAPALAPGRFGMDIRNVAVSPASRAVLETAGVWQALEATAYRRMQVWEERGTAMMTFDAAEVQRAELGWILENGPAVAALWQCLQEAPRAAVRLGALEALETGPDAVTLTVAAPPVADSGSAGSASGLAPAGAAADARREGPLRLRARLVIAADGARSRVRELLGVAVSRSALRDVALATLVRTERGHDGVAYQRFLRDGPLALLPSARPDISSVVWSQAPAVAARRAELDDAAFCAEIGRACEQCLGPVLEADRRLSFPLQQALVARFDPHPRVLLIGDAARVLHPLAGLGANVGFEDVRELLAVLGSVGPGADPGSAGLWRGFARRRRARARFMQDLMAGLRRAYALDNPLLQFIRNTGVDLLNRTAPIKRQIIVEAMGLGPLAGQRAGR